MTTRVCPAFAADNSESKYIIAEVIIIARRRRIIAWTPASAISYRLQPAMGDGAGRLRRGEKCDQRVGRVRIPGTPGGSGVT